MRGIIIDVFLQESHPACFYQDPLTKASFAFERVGEEVLMSGSFLYDGLEPYGIQSPQISKQNRPGNVVQAYLNDLDKNVYAVFKLKKGEIYIMY